MRSLAVIAAVLSAAVLAAGPAALANGRAPVTNGVHFVPGDSHSVYVAATFGLLVSHDDGCSFRWICEQTIGYGGTFDPRYRIAADGAIFATTFTGLRVSRDGGCSFTTATADRPLDDPGRIADKWIDAIDIGPTGEVWVATADGGKPNNVFRSTDNGATFAPRGMLSQAIWWNSLAIAPSRALRVYATGYQVAGARADGGQMPPTAHVEITDDGGDTWTESPLAGVRFGTTPRVYAVGVDRANPDVVLLASTGANRPGGDRLYRSRDGGATWAEVLATPGPILDVAIEPAGDVLVAATGGAFQSADGGATFHAMANAPQLACVGRRDDGTIFGCGTNWEPDNAAVATTTDGATWTKRFQFVELAGPLDCPAGTLEQSTCAGLWPSVQQQFGVTGPPAVCPGAPVIPDATPPALPDAAPPGKAASRGACDAGATTAGQLGALALLGGICATLLLRRRREASRNKPPSPPRDRDGTP